MRPKLYLPTLALLAAGADVAAQEPRVRVIAPSRAYTVTTNEPRAIIGVFTSASARARDTLGLLITGVTPGGPAERAGIEEGNRLQAIGGTNLRLSAADVDAPEMAGVMQRRLTRAMQNVKVGDEVELRVYANGQVRTVKLRAAESEDIATTARRRAEERPTLGIGATATGTVRDTLGVFVMHVNDSGPAARAGIIEGARIAQIGNVDLRVARADAGDEYVGQAKARRLEREVAALKAGDNVELRVWQNGQMRTVRLTVAKAGDLPRRRSFFMFGDGAGVPAMAPLMERMPFGEGMRRIEVERHMQDAMRHLEGLRHFQFDGDGDGDVEVIVTPSAPSAPSTAPAAPRAPRTPGARGASVSGARSASTLAPAGQARRSVVSM